MGRDIIYKPVCASTNSCAAQYLAQKDLSDGTVIITDHQYQGRGQRGHAWYSEPGQNLTFSVVLYPTFLSTQQSFALNIVANLAIQHVLALYVPSGLCIKWPNDVYYQNKKIGGVLVENVAGKRKLKTSIMGIGLNVNQTSFTLRTPISLFLICRRNFSLPKLFGQLLVSLENNYLQLKTQGMAPFKAAYLSNMYWIHEVHTFRDVNHIFRGTIKGIDAIGNLIIEHSDGIPRHYSTQEIMFIA